MRLIYTHAAPLKFLLLKFEGQPVTFQLTVPRSRPIGECFEIAGRLTKTDVVNQISNALALMTNGNDETTLTERSSWRNVLRPHE